MVAANESTLVFTDNSSDPEQHPVLADLKVVDLAADAEPRLKLAEMKKAVANQWKALEGDVSAATARLRNAP